MLHSKKTQRRTRAWPHLLILFLFLIAVVLIEVYSGKIDSVGRQLTLEIDSPASNDVYQVFFDLGYGFRAEDSVLVDVVAQEGRVILPFALPGDQITKLRIDVGLKPGRVRLAGIALETPEYSRRWNLEELYREIRSDVRHHISRVYREGDVLVLEASGNDPHFLLPMGPEEISEELVPLPAVPTEAPLTSKYLAIDVKRGDEDQSFLVFFDIGRGITSSDVVSATIPAGTGFFLARFPLPEDAVRELRIDTGIGPGIIWIRSIEYQSDYTLYSWSPNELVKICPPGYQHDLKTFRVEEDLLLLESIGEDPHFRVRWVEPEL